jgi:HPr kinase/phosphorylase
VEPRPIGLGRLYEECKDALGLSLINGDVLPETDVGHSDIGRPGLVLAGFTDGVKSKQIQVMDQAEVLYLENLAPQERIKRFRNLVDLDIPCVVVAGGLAVPGFLHDLCSSARVPLFSASASATEVIQHLNSYLVVRLAPEASVNGTLVDVYGVGILLTGRSGIGKSECALALVGRGHRLVADDHVRTIAKPPGILIGRSTEPLQSFVEVRGIGLVNIGSIFGIRALRRQKRIEIEVKLREWEDGVSYDRSGLERGLAEIMGVRIPSVTVPLVPGKSLSVIVEVVALSHILRTYGYDAAGSLDEKWIEHIRRKGKPGFETRDIE